MLDLLKNAARRCLKMAARVGSSDKNLSRRRELQAWWKRQVGDQNDFSALLERYPGLINHPDKRKLLALHEQRIHSQFGEDVLLLHRFSIIGAPYKTFIEFGIEDGTECNAANFALHFGWSGLLLDGSDSQVERARVFYHHRRGISQNQVQLRTHFITKENINDLFAKYGFKGELDLLLIDIDGGGSLDMG